MCYFDGATRELMRVPQELLEPLDELLENSRDTFLVENAHKPNKFGDFGRTTQHIIFKFPEDLANHRRSYYLPVWEKYKEAVQPIIDHVTPYYGYTEGATCRIMLAKLKARKEIALHVDGHPSSDKPHKIHVPLITSPEVVFLSEEKEIHLERGIAYEVNNKVMHGGRNGTDQDRVHLIFDYYET
jgi:hypothetical protein